MDRFESFLVKFFTFFWALDEHTIYNKSEQLWTPTHSYTPQVLCLIVIVNVTDPEFFSPCRFYYQLDVIIIEDAIRPIFADRCRRYLGGRGF